MNCETVQRLLDEIPLSLWSEQRNTSVHEHCHSCNDCLQRLEEQKLIFAEFDELFLPEPSNIVIDFSQQVESELSQGLAQRKMSSSAAYLTVASLTIILLGLFDQTFLQGELSFERLLGPNSWEFTLYQISNSPALAITLILASLVYCFSSNTTATLNHRSASSTSSENG